MPFDRVALAVVDRPGLRVVLGHLEHLLDSGPSVVAVRPSPGCQEPSSSWPQAPGDRTHNPPIPRHGWAAPERRMICAQPSLLVVSVASGTESAGRSRSGSDDTLGYVQQLWHFHSWHGDHPLWRMKRPDPFPSSEHPRIHDDLRRALPSALQQCEHRVSRGHRPGARPHPLRPSPGGEVAAGGPGVLGASGAGGALSVF